MSYSQFKSDFQHIHQSEVYGKNLFKTASRIKFGAQTKKKLEFLYQLEVQTLERYITFSKDTGNENKFPYWWAVKGYFDGIVFAILPWSMAMYLLAKGTKSFTVVWQRLEANSNETNRDFYAYIYAHEKAIEAFAKKELNKEIDSTKPILSLLSRR